MSTPLKTKNSFSTNEASIKSGMPSCSSYSTDAMSFRKEDQKLKGKKVSFEKKLTVIYVDSFKEHNLVNTYPDAIKGQEQKDSKVYCRCLIY